MPKQGSARLVLAVVPALLAALSLAAVAGAGPARGTAVSAKDDAVKLARDWVRDNREALGLRPNDIADLAVSDSYADSDTGVAHVYFVQRYQGVEIFNALLNVTVAADGTVSASESRLFAAIDAKIRGESASRSRAQALDAAAANLGVPKGALEVNYAELTYQPVGGALVLAWELELVDSGSGPAWNVRVDARTGAVLAKDALDAHAGTYTVFGIPNESPDDGARTSIANPDRAPASPYGWHDTNGAAGAEYTITRGNNVYAYRDRDANNSADTGSSPSGGSSLTFDFGLDLTQAPVNYGPASVTNLFYWNNVIHDVFYAHGFTEAAGNFQSNNYGRGGRGADPVLAESQDGSGKNNANFSTPRDGFAPRMQMFEWTYPFPNTVTVGASSYDGSSADFGPQVTETGLSGTVVDALDGAGTRPTRARRSSASRPARSPSSTAARARSASR